MYGCVNLDTKALLPEIFVGADFMYFWLVSSLVARRDYLNFNLD